MITLGISCFYHDSAAVILKDGKIVAAATEERFSRKKHDNGFPERAIEYCLNELGIAINEVNLIAFYEKPILKFERVLCQHLHSFPKSYKTFISSMGAWLDHKLDIPKLLRKSFHYVGKVTYVPHHLSHAASSYYLSGYNKAVIVTLDGVGEWATTAIGIGDGNTLRLEKQIDFPHSLGLFYSTITAYLGFKVNSDEYKVMGLAAYGDPRPFSKHMDKLLSQFNDGSYALDMKYFDYLWSDHMPSKKMESLFSLPIRKPEDQILTQHEDIAAAAQQKLEQVIFKLLRKAHEKYPVPSLCLAGGVALNSVMNGKILSQTPFKEIYITPDPGDGGGALGAALHAWYHSGHPDVFRKKRTVFTPYLGPNFSDIQIEQILDRYPVKYRYYQDLSELTDLVSDYLIKQKVIGWFQGRMEWGPRALGNRSILASAAKAEMKDIINSKVKKREMFRPFAPVILERYVDKYFVRPTKEPLELEKYMLMVYPFTQPGVTEAPATVHVNGTGRLQTISRADNPRYYDLIEAYRKKTGTPIIVNTSFNVREPIVCSPEDAVRCFLGTQVDYLVIGRYLVKK